MFGIKSREPKTLLPVYQSTELSVFNAKSQPSIFDAESLTPTQRTDLLHRCVSSLMSYASISYQYVATYVTPERQTILRD